MSLLAQRISDERIEDFVHVTKVAEELSMNPQTIKRWLKKGEVDDVKWGRDRRKWIFVHKDSIRLLRDHRDGITITR